VSPDTTPYFNEQAQQRFNKLQDVTSSNAAAEQLKIQAAQFHKLQVVTPAAAAAAATLEQRQQ
jgi:hypothetical protein